MAYIVVYRDPKIEQVRAQVITKPFYSGGDVLRKELAEACGVPVERVLDVSEHIYVKAAEMLAPYIAAYYNEDASSIEGM